MKIQHFSFLLALIIALSGLTACQKKEISLLKELHEKLAETKGDLVKAKIALKDFMREKEVKIQEAIKDFQESKGEERDYRYLDFNRHYYDKDGIRELVDFTYKYTLDPEFNQLFENFKKKWGIFFQEDLLYKK